MIDWIRRKNTIDIRQYLKKKNNYENKEKSSQDWVNPFILTIQYFLFQDTLTNLEPFFTESHTTSYYKNGYNTDIHKSCKSRIHLKNLEESVHEIRNSVQDLIATVMKNAVSTSNEALDKKIITTNIANNIDWFCFLIFFSATIGIDIN